jgi:hypothetical protein
MCLQLYRPQAFVLARIQKDHNNKSLPCVYPPKLLLLLNLKRLLLWPRNSIIHRLDKKESSIDLIGNRKIVNQILFVMIKVKISKNFDCVGSYNKGFRASLVRDVIYLTQHPFVHGISPFHIMELRSKPILLRRPKSWILPVDLFQYLYQTIV